MTFLAETDLSMYTSHHKLPVNALDEFVRVCVHMSVCKPDKFYKGCEQ